MHSSRINTNIAQAVCDLQTPRAGRCHLQPSALIPHFKDVESHDSTGSLAQPGRGRAGPGSKGL